MHTHLIFEARNSAGDWLETCFVLLEIGWRLAGGKGWKFAGCLLVKSTKVTTCWRFAEVLLEFCFKRNVQLAGDLLQSPGRMKQKKIVNLLEMCWRFAGNLLKLAGDLHRK